MRFLIEPICGFSKKFMAEQQDAHPILLTYHHFPYQHRQDGEIFYWVDFESFEDLGTFLGNWNGSVRIYQDGHWLANNRWDGVKEWPEELQQPLMGLYLDGIGW